MPLMVTVDYDRQAPTSLIDPLILFPLLIKLLILCAVARLDIFQTHQKSKWSRPSSASPKVTTRSWRVWCTENRERRCRGPRTARPSTSTSASCTATPARATCCPSTTSRGTTLETTGAAPRIGSVTRTRTSSCTAPPWSWSSNETSRSPTASNWNGSPSANTQSWSTVSGTVPSPWVFCVFFFQSLVSTIW